MIEMKNSSSARRFVFNTQFFRRLSLSFRTSRTLHPSEMPKPVSHGRKKSKSPFAGATGLKRANSLSQHQKDMKDKRKRIEEIFADAKTPGSESLDADEFGTVLEKMVVEAGVTEPVTPRAVDWVMERADSTGDSSSLSMEEMERGMAIWGGYLQKKDFIDSLMKRFDHDGDDKLSREELKGYINELKGGEAPTDAEMDWIIQRCDKGDFDTDAGDGHIGRVELLDVADEWCYLPRDVNGPVSDSDEELLDEDGGSAVTVTGGGKGGCCVVQ